MSYPLYGNVIIDSSNGGSLGGTLTISNSCNTSTLNNQASIAFALADTSYGTLNQGLFRSGTDFADVRITALIDNISPTIGTGLSVSVSSNHSQQPVEALRIRSNGNIGIGRSNPLSKLDVSGNINVSGTIFAKLRNITSVSGETTLPLLYNTTTNEVQYNNQPFIDVSLNATPRVLSTNSYNRFIIITSVSGGNQLHLPTPSVAFPASLTIFNASTNSAVLATTNGGFRIGSTSPANPTLLGNTCLTLQTNGINWFRTAFI